MDGMLTCGNVNRLWIPLKSIPLEPNPNPEVEPDVELEL